MVALLDFDTQLKRKQKVVATTDLRGVPEGTAGRVLLVNGFAWVRYRVLFENGVDIGTLDRKYVATPDEYADLLRRRASGELDVVEAEESEGTEDAGAEAAAESGESKVVNGVAIPPYLLERSRNRREALSA